MARIGLRSVLNGEFVQRLAGSVSSPDPFQDFRGTTPRPLGTSVDFRSVLRNGAQIYAGAVEGLNSTISVLNISRSTLKDLKEITGKVIDVVEQATRPGIGSQSRKRLDNKFRQLATEFQDVVGNAKLGTRDLLTDEGLAEIFVAMGLDPQTSKSISEVFERFVLATSDESLASEKAKADRPLDIPASAFGPTGTELVSTFTENQQFNVGTELNTGLRADGFSVYESDDTDSFSAGGYNPATDSIIVHSEETLNSTMVPGLTADITLLATNEDTGYSVISSTDDFLGYNAANEEEVFLVDEVGNVVHQFTDFTATQSLLAVDISADDGTIAVVYDDTFDSTTYVDTITYGTLGEDPTTSTVLNIASAGFVAAFDTVKISDNGGYVATLNGATGTAGLYDVATQTNDANIALQTQVIDIGFIDGDTLALLRDSPGPGKIIEAYKDGSGVEQTHIIGNVNITAANFSTLQSTGDIAFIDQLADELKQLTYDYNVEGSIDTATVILDTSSLTDENATVVSLAENSETGQTDFGLVGSLTGEVYDELYRIEVDAVTGAVTTNDIAGSATYPVSAGFISASTSAYQAEDEKGYNTGFESLNLQTIGEKTVSIRETLTSDVELLAVNEGKGYSVIQSDQDFLGYNPSNYNQLFIVDTSGHIVQQVTNNTVAITVYNSADIANDRLTIAAISNDSVAQVFAVSSFGVDPSTAAVTTTDVGAPLAPTDEIGDIKISTTGAYVAYRETDTTGDRSSQIRLKDVATQTDDTFLSGDSDIDLVTGDNNKFDFYTGIGLALIKQDGATQSVVTYQYNSSEYDIIALGINAVGEFAASQGGAGSAALIAVEDEAISTVRVFNSGTGEIGSYRLHTQGDDIDTLSIANDKASGVGSAKAKLGLYGTIDQISDDADQEFYTLDIDYAQGAKAGRQLSRSVDEFSKIFDRSRSIERRPDAYTLLADLKELEKQIDANLTAIDKAEKVVGENIELVRATGLAFLEISDRITSETDADEVARQLRKEIRNDAKSALSQAENLESITVQQLVLAASQS